MNAQLERIYAASWASVENLLAGHSKVSRPLLINVPEGYRTAQVRLLVVGQETFGWGWQNGAPLRTIPDLMQLYADFDCGRSYRPSPFWRAARHLYAQLNPGAVHGGFIWSNLVRVDFGRRRAPATVEEALARLQWLNQEIAVTKPDVVVFFTGPRYEDRLKSQFQLDDIRELNGGLAELRLAGVAAQAFRTYHPRYLSMSRRWGQLDTIISMVTGSSLEHP